LFNLHPSSVLLRPRTAPKAENFCQEVVSGINARDAAAGANGATARWNHRRTHFRIGDRRRPCYTSGMNLILIIVVLLLLLDGGGFYYGGPVYGGSGLGLVLLILLILWLTGNLGRRGGPRL
jgi:hypothetical protein